MDLLTTAAALTLTGQGNYNSMPYQTAALSLASGIMGSYFQRLDAGTNAMTQLSALWAVSLMMRGPAEALPQPVTQWTASTGPNGRGEIDLGEGYSLELNENNSEIVVKNANTGETTRIWGDPHVDVDGKHQYDFWGTTTFELENGTKITINTEAAPGNPNVYYASELVITKGAQAITVNGISQLETGDLSVTMGNNGYAIDAATRDGFTLQENATGGGWRSGLTGQVATQADLDATRPGAAYGPGSNTPSIAEFSQMLSDFLIFGAIVSFAAEASAPAQGGDGRCGVGGFAAQASALAQVGDGRCG